MAPGSVPAPRDYARFGRKLLEELPARKRRRRLAQLETELNHRLQSYRGENYWREVDSIIEDLRAVGHDLWSHDYSGSWHIWGGDYMRPETAGKLQIRFDCEGDLWISWHSVDSPVLRGCARGWALVEDGSCLFVFAFLVVGACVGAVIGALVGHTGIGLAVGIVLGVAVGSVLNRLTETI